ncbi:nascent polypeptide-associated complex protein [Halomicroarcula sp. GCM10025817]|uniref:nascent polypeptide-associated complex protein n=1 Tax=Haloarcula TaxID=2237 RepID=UPI0023E8AD30|nr:nascent polypeptide-associated complex protein [Halomicroarcula sp. SYNS111]
MFGGGGGMDPRKLQQMMEQMGIDMEDIDAEEVIIRTPEEELVFTDAEVQLMAAQGQKTYQVVGEPESRPRDGTSGAADETESEGTADEADEAETESSGPVTISEGDIELVAMRAGVDEATARQALEDNDGDLADAVDQLE